MGLVNDILPKVLANSIVKSSTFVSHVTRVHDEHVNDNSLNRPFKHQNKDLFPLLMKFNELKFKIFKPTKQM